MLFDNNGESKVCIQFRDGVVYVHQEILVQVFGFFHTDLVTSSGFDLRHVNYPPEITCESFRYCISFAYNWLVLPEVKEIRNGLAPCDKVLSKTLSYFNASDGLIEAICLVIRAS